MSYDIDYCRKYEPIFGSWYIKNKLGEGNFGAVFEIEREDFGTKYHAALKIISIPKNRSELESIMNDTMDVSATEKYIEQVVERIVKEFELMAKLKGNSNVVSYEDHQVIRHADDAGWDVLIRMELLTPMLTYFKNKDITRRDVVRLGIDICRALELCKKNNIIHRDIKPENIFVSESGDFKLGDFGIAKQVEESQSELTKIGTPTYMAPEVVKGYEYDASVDMYSLGVVMYRFLNHNRTPFMPQYPAEISYGDKDRAFGERVNSGKPFPMPSNVGSVELANIILKACSYEPSKRFSSPEQMRRLLEGVLAKTNDAVLGVSVAPHVAAPVANAVPVQNQSASYENNDEGTALIDTPVQSQPFAQSQSQVRYTVNPGETIVFDNITGKNILLSRTTQEPVDIVIIKPNGVKNLFEAWNKKDIGLAAGDKVQITNGNSAVVSFNGHLGVSAIQVPYAGPTPKKKKKSKALPIILVILVLLVIFAGVGVAFVLGLFGTLPDGNDVQNNNVSGQTVQLERIDGLSSHYALPENETLTLSPVAFPEGAEHEEFVYSSSDESVAYVDGNELVSVSSGEAVITVSSGNVTLEFNVIVERDLESAEAEIREKLKREIEKFSLEVSNSMAVINGNTEKDLTGLADRIESANETMNELFKTVSLISLSTGELDDFHSKWSDLYDEVGDIMEEVEKASDKKCTKCGKTGHLADTCTYNAPAYKPKCPDCGASDHTVHPTCWYCGAKDHTVHPQCGVCQSYDHTTNNHPAISLDFN